MRTRLMVITYGHHRQDERHREKNKFVRQSEIVPGIGGARHLRLKYLIKFLFFRIRNALW